MWEQIGKTIVSTLAFLYISFQSIFQPYLNPTPDTIARGYQYDTSQATSSSQLKADESLATPSANLAPVQITLDPDISNESRYQLEQHPSGKEGFFVLKNTPSENMTTRDELNDAVNQYRITHGLNELYIDPQLCDIAYQRAQEASQDFSHQRFSEHVDAGDYDYTGFNRIGENLWSGSFSGVHIVEFGWDRSPGHQANLQGEWSRGCGGIYDVAVAFIFAR